jgi:hypothetical protein
MRTGTTRLAAIAISLVSLTLPASAVGATSSDVTAASKSVVRVERFQSSERVPEKSAAFAIDDQGRFLTTISAVARSGKLEVYVGNRKKPYAAREITNDAPPGLTLIQIVGDAPDLPALTPAESTPTDRSYWIVPPPGGAGSDRTARSRPIKTQLITPPPSCSQAAGVKTGRAAARPRTNGSPVVNSLGHFVGVMRANPPADPPGTAECKYAQFLPANEVPNALAAVPSPKRADFPAVIVVIVLAIALILTNVFFLLRRRRAVAEPILVKPTEAPPTTTEAPAPGTPIDDELEITLLRPRDQSTLVSSPAKTTRVSRSPAATRVSESPDPAPDSDDDLGPISLR